MDTALLTLLLWDWVNINSQDNSLHSMTLTTFNNFKTHKHGTLRYSDKVVNESYLWVLLIMKKPKSFNVWIRIVSFPEAKSLNTVLKIQTINVAGHSGLVVARVTDVSEIPGSNLTAGSGVYHDSHCDVGPRKCAAHQQCTAPVDSAFHPMRDGKRSTVSAFGLSNLYYY